MRDYGNKDGWHPDDKSSKAEADYRDGTPDEHCGRCTMFRPPHSCTAVDGVIHSYGVCDYFKDKS
jgi:hypothetical protein